MKKRNKSPRKNQARRKKIFILTLVLLAMLAFLVFAFKPAGKNISKTTPSPTINLQPPTAQDLKESDGNKGRLSQQIEETTKPVTQGTTSPQPSPPKAEIIIVDAGQYGQEIEIRASVHEVIENNGTCRATLSKNGNVVSKDTKGEADASSTLCPVISFSRLDFQSPGEWTLDFSYESANVKTSTRSKVTII